MVLGTVQYKRQEDNMEEEMAPSGGVGVGVGGMEGDEIGSLSSENLHHEGGMGSSHGHVRFVDSTIRYHMR